MSDLRIAPCTLDDLARLEAAGLSRRAADHLRKRFAWQQAGDAVLLLAWRDDALVGQGTLTWASKYDEVRATSPDIAEINALEATPQGQGTGSALIAEAERLAAEHGCRGIGLAVSPDNPAAHRLYERLGYTETHTRVIDRWSERSDDGADIDHADACDLMVKRF